MNQHHYVTIHGRRYSLDDLQHGAHPSLSLQTVADRLRRYMSLEEAKTTPKYPKRWPRRFDDAVAAYLECQGTDPQVRSLAAGLVLASLTLLPHTLTP